MKNLKSLVLVFTVLSLTSCAGHDWDRQELSEAEIEMHFKKANEIEPAAGNIAILKELMEPRANVLMFLE